MKYTLNTDFSSLNGPKAANWIMDFQDMLNKPLWTAAAIHGFWGIS